MRPDYVPRAWTRGPINRRFWRSPRRVFAWLLAAPLVTGGVALGVLLAGQTALGVLLAVARLGRTRRLGAAAPAV